MSDADAKFDAAYAQIFSRWVDSEMAGLSATERDFIVANVCLNQSLNGGLMLYYENSYGNAAEDAVAAFRRMGVVKAARLLEHANRLMGDGGPSKNQDERGVQLEALLDNAVDEMVEYSDQLNAMAEEIKEASLRWVQSASL